MATVEKKSTKIKGGARPGAGRKKGSPNKKTAKLQQEVAASGVTPLDFMLRIMRTEPKADMPPRDWLAAVTLRFEAAKAAAPYVHPRLAAIEHTAPEGLDMRIETVKRIIVDPRGPSN